MNKNKIELLFTLFGGIAVVVVFISWVYLIFIELYNNYLVNNLFDSIEIFIFLLIGTGLTYGSVIYIMTRYGRIKRKLEEKYPNEQDIDKYFFDNDNKKPTLSILIPSYKEEVDVVKMTLLSAALLEYHHKNIILLIDDPVFYSDEGDKKRYLSTIDLVDNTSKIFNDIQSEITKKYNLFNERVSSGNLKLDSEIRELADLYDFIQRWFEKQILDYEVKNHAEHFFENQIIGNGRLRFRELRNKIFSLKESINDLSVNDFYFYYRKALSLFNVNFITFQRKLYENISHEPNKAMNLNTYISLMGRNYKISESEGKKILVEDKNGDIRVPSSDYLITLDADSILDYSYAKKLVYFLELPKNKKIAVAQTPYNTFPCPFIDVERIAGATTDIQHYIHQGFEYYSASFWVGANAMLRFKALDYIKEEDNERGYKIYRYVQDRTVIEDTESSIDLINKGWNVYNYHDRLAYSATPSDFGSLIIQRRRWANGGLIIFPKLVKYFFNRNKKKTSKIFEVFVRSHYLTSIAIVNFGILLMMFYPFDGNLHVVLLVLVALIYFLFYSYDLRSLGYQNRDLFRVYSLNLLMIPINVAGVLKSLQQMIMKSKIPFGRTPKVQGRTVAPAGFILFELLITIYLMFGFYFDITMNRYEHAIFSIINGVFMIYAIHYFIGWKNSINDLLLVFKTNKR